jgi:hypothetical protein
MTKRGNCHQRRHFSYFLHSKLATDGEAWAVVRGWHAAKRRAHAFDVKELEMNIRPLLLGLPLLLTGCSTMSNFSWSSLSPLNWFGSSLEVSAKGVGDLNAGTPMSESAINDGLKGDYRLRGGMATSQGQIVSYYQAMDGNDVKLVITGEPKGHVQRVDVMDSKVATEWGSKLGTPFSDLYSKAFGACKPADGDDAGKVECVAEQSKYVTYIFSGKWAGQQDIIPPDDTLKSWTISKIIWHAKPQ